MSFQLFRFVFLIKKRLLELDAGFTALLLGLKVVFVSEAAPEPELSAGIRRGVVVPLHHVVPTGSRVQDLVAALCWT